MNESTLDFIFESQHNPYELTYEFSSFAERHINNGIFFLKNFLLATEAVVQERRTYIIKTLKDEIKVASFLTQFSRSTESYCTVEVSNPLIYKGIRFWTSFNGQIKYWTNGEILQEQRTDPDIVYNLFSHNYHWIYGRVMETFDLIDAGEHIKESDKALALYDLSPKLISKMDEESVSLEVLKKVFKK